MEEEDEEDMEMIEGHKSVDMAQPLSSNSDGAKVQKLV